MSGSSESIILAKMRLLDLAQDIIDKKKHFNDVLPLVENAMSDFVNFGEGNKALLMLQDVNYPSDEVALVYLLLLHHSAGVARINDLKDATSLVLVQIFNRHAKVFIQNGNYRDAVYAYEKALGWIEKFDADEIKIFLYNNLAVAYEVLGEITSAYNALSKASILTRKLGGSEYDEIISKNMNRLNRIING